MHNHRSIQYQAQRRAAIEDVIGRFPDMPTYTLARKLTKDHPTLFRDMEGARSALRYHRGATGTRDRHRGKHPRPHGKQTDRAPIPQSLAKPWETYHLEGKRVLVMSDLHCPFHDVGAIEAALEYGEHFRPDAILWNGDFFDFYSLSRYERDPDGPTARQELELGAAIFTHVRQRFPKARQIFKLGNHDERWADFCARKAPEIWDVARFSWQTIAGIKESGVEIVDGKRPIMVGPLMVLHGHEKGRGISSPVNPARGAFIRLLCSTLEGHLHRTSEHTERTADGRIIACRSTGCLCDLHPSYAVLNKWDHGFATVLRDGDGYECRLHRIVNGKVR